MSRRIGYILMASIRQVEADHLDHLQEEAANSGLLSQAEQESLI